MKKIVLIAIAAASFALDTGMDESLDLFYGWGQRMLADFDDIDKNMADSQKVFANLKDIHEFDDLSYLTDSQKDILKKFISYKKPIDLGKNKSLKYFMDKLEQCK